MPPPPPSSSRARLPLWLLHLPVATLALLSLVLADFHLWVDLHLPTPLSTPLLLLWAVSVLTFGIFAGPRFAGTTRIHWAHPRLTGRAAHLLLLPTWLLLPALALNTAHYYRRLAENRIDTSPHVPAPLLVGILLLAWLTLAHLYIRTPTPAPTPLPRNRLRTIALTAWFLAVPFLILASFALHHAHFPPPQPVDLAVVFGHRVMPDGTPSDTLRNRTLAAVQLYKQGRVRHILLSGAASSGPDGRHSEVLAMRQVTDAHHIPREHVTLDPVGINTRATVEATQRLMTTRGFSSAVAVSSATHLPRIHLAFRQAGINVYSVASDSPLRPSADPPAILRELVGIPMYALNPHYRPALAQELAVKNPRLVIHKSANKLELYDGTTLVRTYRCITGGNPGDKQIEGDRRTPIGHFKICYKNPESKFHLSMGLDYPNIDAAQRGLRENLISQAEYDQIIAAINSGGIPNWYTALGGEIMIHGHAEGRTGTLGCIAVTNPEIEELYAICPVGTPVEIRE